MKKETVFTASGGSSGREAPEREAVAADRRAGAVSPASASPPLRLFWVHRSAMDRASAESLGPSGRRTRSQRRRAARRRARG